MNNKFEIHYDREFETDVRKWKKKKSGLQEEIKAIVNFILEFGFIPDDYNPHPLTDPSLPYYGYNDFHLFEGKLDLVVIYAEFDKHKVFRFIRLGSHEELFQNNSEE